MRFDPPLFVSGEILLVGVYNPVPGHFRDIESNVNRFCEVKSVPLEECLRRVEEPFGMFVDVVLSSVP
ncbi:hypothetical protein EA462_14315 [Natrarchaeobius halalkaliphilus]|uniref:Uncharacterized protein n=1 Tax=Natrarchaeobius halalkaliphilus TaxID=1679091 RepID=A0A3N6LJ13_9EURY|nr:hypothetical protein EA462_14315 [Natrarchaeobius halalkaliphilus]